MTATKPLGVYGNGVGVTTPLDHKIAQSGLLTKASAANLIRPGLFWGGTGTIITGTAGMAYSVAAFTAALTRSAAAGTVLLANDGAVSVATTAAPGSNSRIDIIYVWAREFALDGVDSNPVIGVAQGTAAALPVAPSLAAFPGAIEIGRATVASGATATNGAGVTISQTGIFTATAGGIVAVRNSTERAAGTWVEGQVIYRVDTDVLEKFDGTTWTLVSPPAIDTPIIPGAPTITGGTGGVSANGEVFFNGASSILIPGVFGTGYSTEVVIEVTSAAAVANCLLRLVTAGGVDLATGYTNNLIQLPTTATAISSVAGSTTQWDILRVTTTGSYTRIVIARAAEANRKTMLGGCVDSTNVNNGGGGNSSGGVHTGLRITFTGTTAIGVVRFRAVSNLT